MGKCYCDYCDVFLTNDSVTVRKQHNDGNRHKYNVCEYYRRYAGEKLQEEIDDVVEEFEIKVAKGIIKPTYGIPPPPKQDNQEETENKEQQESESKPELSDQMDMKIEQGAVPASS